jgi:hypothetical protein
MKALSAILNETEVGTRIPTPRSRRLAALWPEVERVFGDDVENLFHNGYEVAAVDTRHGYTVVGDHHPALRWLGEMMDGRFTVRAYYTHPNDRGWDPGPEWRTSAAWGGLAKMAAAAMSRICRGLDPLIPRASGQTVLSGAPLSQQFTVSG